MTVGSPSSSSVATTVTDDIAWFSVALTSSSGTNTGASLTGVTVMVSSSAEDCAPSEAVTMTVKVPGADGAPTIVLPSRLSPAGSPVADSVTALPSGSRASTWIPSIALSSTVVTSATGLMAGASSTSVTFTVTCASSLSAPLVARTVSV